MCAELKLNILQVDLVYPIPLTHINKKSAVSVIMLHTLIPLSFVSVCMEGNNGFTRVKWESYVLKIKTSFSGEA